MIELDTIGMVGSGLIASAATWALRVESRLAKLELRRMGGGP